MPFDDQNDNTRSYVQLAHDSVIGHYRIIERIGAGGMGEVYLAEDTKLGRKVALKFLPLYLCQSSACRARFTREARAAAKVNHPNIVTIHDVSEFNGRPFFAMEYVEGQTIRDLYKNGEVALSRTIEVAIQVCEGLAKAHAAGIVHRDIKPSNIIINRDGRAKIVDFGLASLYDSEHVTRTGSTLGTVGYMSPEQARGEVVDARSDLFSLGVVLYEMITGRAPFKGASEAAAIQNVIEAVPEPLARYKTGAPDDLQRIVDKLLSKDRSLRYQHADELSADLRRLITTHANPQLPRRNPRNRYVMAAAVVAILIAAGYWGATSFLDKDKPKPDSMRRMLAVLPFDNLSPDPDQEYFSDGLTDELTNSLSQIQSLCVISRSSLMTFKGSNKTIPEIAKALKVQYIVEGTVRRAGNKLRVTAQLIDADADAHLWSRSYSGTLDDVFDMQDSVSRAIVDGIRIQLTSNESRRLSKRPFNDARAYEFYLRGKNEINIGTPEAIRRGPEYFEQGLAIVGDNPLIYSGLAWAYWNMVNSGFEQEAGISKSLDCAQKALSLDPESAEAHAVLGWIAAGFLGDQKKAMFHYKSALAIDSSNELALRGGLLSCYVYLGKTSAARALNSRYLRSYPLDSLAPLRQQADEKLWSGYFLQALEPLRRSRQMGERLPFAAFLHAIVLSACDSTDQALLVIDSCTQAYPEDIASTFCRMLKCALHLDKAGALRELAPDEQMTCRRDAQWSFHVGDLLVKAGAKGEALDWLENAVTRGFINYPFMQKDPFLDSLRGDERFKKLLERVKYEWEHFAV